MCENRSVIPKRWTDLKLPDLLVWAAMIVIPMQTAAAGIERIAGGYVGTNIVSSPASLEIVPADVHFEIDIRDRGFILSWQSLSEISSGQKHHFKVAFKPSRRPGIYQAQMRCDLFGHARPLDPMRGKPYVWAHVSVDFLVLYTMSIADDGSHDLSIYRYRLGDGEVGLEFERVRNNESGMSIKAAMRKVSSKSLVKRLGEQHGSPDCE